MKTTVINILLASAALFAIACKKEVMIDLKEKGTEIVIEGHITNDNNPAEVIITKTTDFNNDNFFPEVKGAQVSISDNAGNSETMSEISPGRYRSSNLKGTPGRTYYLTVTIDGKTYSAMSAMPMVMQLDTVIGKQELFVGKTVYNVYPIFKDEAGVKNYYRFIQYVNSQRLPGSTVIDDVLTDGNYNVQPITNDIHSVSNGDLLQLEMQTIDKATFDYFDSMAHTNMGTNAPANPVSNIEGGALGYFSAHTTQKKNLWINK